MEPDDQQRQWRGLVKLQDAKKLFSPLSNSSKIKYTSISASSSHVILGANSGGIYCFTANEFKFIRLIANREGNISLLRFSPVNGILAVAAGGNNVCFWEHNLDNGNESKRFHVSSVLRDSIITDMVWDSRGTRLFYGDNQGRIAIAYVPKLSRKFGSSSLFKRVDEVIHSEKVAIVQLDMWKDYLLVSTTQRCCLIKLQGENIESVIQVGQKPREGLYGGLFHPRWEGHPPVICSSRPRSRLWEANVEGRVVTTVRNGGVTIPPSLIIDIGAAVIPEASLAISLKSFNFHRLSLLSDSYLVTWEGRNLFIFHSSSYSLSSWLEDMNDITDVVCVGDTIYVLYDNCQSIICLHYLTMEELLKSVIDVTNWSLAKQVLLQYTDVVRDELMSNQDVAVMAAAVLCSIRDTGTFPGKLQELVSLVESKGINVFNQEAVDEIDGSVQKDSPQEEQPITEQPPSTENNIEEENLFELEGGGDSSTHQTFNEVVTSNPSPQQLPTNQNALAETTLPTGVSPSEAPPPPPDLMVRMGSLVEADEGNDDIVVVRSREKKKKSKSKKRRGSLDSRLATLPISQPGLDDISEIDTVLRSEFSPSQSQLSSTATSLDNSPHASLSSSPKFETISSADSIDFRAPPTNEGRSPEINSSRTQSVDIVKDEHHTHLRSHSLTTEAEFPKQKPQGILLRVKSIASSQDGSIQRTSRFMKEILSSISPTPTATAESGGNGSSPPEVGVCLMSPKAVSSPSPPLDEETLKFVESINSTKSSLDTPLTICSPQLMTEVLRKWREELHNYHAHLSSLSADTPTDKIFFYSPYTMIDDSLKDLVVEFNTCCLEMEILRQNESMIDFISTYYHVLNITRVKNFLYRKPLDVMCKGFRALGHHEFNVKMSSEEILKLSPEHSLCLVTKLYVERSDGFLLLCVNNYPVIQPCEVAAVCKLDHNDSTPDDQPDLLTYSCYLDKLFSQKKSLHSSFANIQLLINSLVALLTFKPTNPVKDENRFPLPHSHLAKWPYQTALSGLTSCCEHLMSDDDLRQICDIFNENGYWEGYLQICLILKATEEVLQALSCLKSFSLLQETAAKSSIFATPTNWQKFTALLVSLDLPVEPVDNSDDLNWEQLVKEMVRQIGVDEVGEILKSIELKWSLSGGLHELLINLTTVHREQRVIAHTLLEQLDRYLWLSRPASLGPVLSAVYQKEEEELKLKREEEKEERSSPPHSIASPPPPESSLDIGHSYIEDAASHWGIKSSSTKCPVCAQSITWKVSDKGMIAFQCGHVFHRHCVPELACAVCFMKNYKSHLIATHCVS